MRRVFVISLVFCMLCAGTALAEEKVSLFKVYLNEKTTDNFLNAYNEYEAQRQDTVNFNATIILSYLHLLELERNLALLDENAVKLGNKTKFQYGNILLELRQYDEAINLYKQLNEKVPKWSCPWRHRGEAHWKKKEYDKAVMALEKAIETRETHFDAYTMLAEVLTEMEQYDRAMEVFEKGLTYYGKDIEDPEEEVDMLEVEFLYLDLCEKTGQTEKYREQYEKLKKLAPHDERLKK